MINNQALLGCLRTGKVKHSQWCQRRLAGSQVKTVCVWSGRRSYSPRLSTDQTKAIDLFEWNQFQLHRIRTEWRIDHRKKIRDWLSHHSLQPEYRVLKQPAGQGIFSWNTFLDWLKQWELHTEARFRWKTLRVNLHCSRLTDTHTQQQKDV